MSQQDCCTETIVDQRILDRIRSLQQPGQTSLIRQIVAMYLDASPQCMEQIRFAIRENDAEMLRISAHTLKSSSANIGATQLAERFKMFEDFARNRQMDAAAQKLDQLTLAYEKVVEHLQAILLTEDASDAQESSI